jgi:hemerythrin
MTPFAWTDEFATGVKRIDEEHQRLFGLVDSFYQALGKQDTRRSSNG